MKKIKMKIAPLVGKGEGKNTSANYSSSAHHQRQRLLAWLRAYGSIDTLTARRELDILGVAPRIFELRHRYGQQIDKIWVDRPSDCGQLHRVALYVLLPGGAPNE